MDKIYIEEKTKEHAKTVNGTDIYRDGEYASKMDYIAGYKQALADLQEIETSQTR